MRRAAEEQAWARSELQAETTEGIDRDGFLDLLTNEPIAMLLVAAHAAHSSVNPFAASLALADDKSHSITADELRSEQLAALASGLVFLNACEAAAGGSIGASSVGLASAFADGGAGAVIAPRWSVDDREGLDMAKRLLQRIWRGERIGTVLRDARHSEGDSVDSLAYVLWGDVSAAFDQARK